jgi:hypothetical protein
MANEPEDTLPANDGANRKRDITRQSAQTKTPPPGGSGVLYS